MERLLTTVERLEAYNHSDWCRPVDVFDGAVIADLSDEEIHDRLDSVYFHRKGVIVQNRKILDYNRSQPSHHVFVLKKPLF